MTNHIIDGSIPKKRFPTGILQLTLFSSSNEPLAERLVFINHSDFLDIDIKKEKATYSKRQQVKMILDVKDQAIPTVGSFSVAVIDETRVPFNDDLETTILSNLLLTSDLKGYIERPNYYFSKTDDHKRKNIDLLMLTQGYSRFTWKNILTQSFPALQFKPEESLEISGMVTQLKGEKLVNAGVGLISVEAEPLVLNTRTNTEGRFIFSNLFFNDSTRFVLQAVNPKNNNNVKIEADRRPEQVISSNKNSPSAGHYDNNFMVKFLGNNKDVLKPFRTREGTKVLQEAVITRKKNSIRTFTSLDGPVKNSTNLNGSGNADAVIPGEKLQKYISLFDGILFNLPAGIRMKNGFFIARGLSGVQVILDGVYIDQSELSTINPRYVEAIEILYEGAKTAIYGKRAYGMSVMLITSISGTARTLTPQVETPGLLKYTPKGFYKVREFYSPKYSFQDTTMRTPDLRSTIYWNPGLLTDSTGTTSFNFFTSDKMGDYKVIIEGINSNGKVGRQILKFKVE